MTSQMARSGWQALPEGREWSRCLLGGLGVVRRPSQRARSGQQALLEKRE